MSLDHMWFQTKNNIDKTDKKKKKRKKELKRKGANKTNCHSDGGEKSFSRHWKIWVCLWKHWTKNEQTDRHRYLDHQMILLKLCLLHGVPDHVALQTQKNHVSVRVRDWGPRRQTSYRPWMESEKRITKWFLSLLVMETEDKGKNNRSPVALIWADTRELSWRWNFACFNLSDRLYKVLPKEKHFLNL